MAKPSHIRWKWGQIRFLYFWACYKLFQMNLAGFIWIVTSIKNSTLPKRMNVPLVSQLTMSSIVGSGKPFISFNYLTYSTNKGCKRCVSGKRTSTSMALEKLSVLRTLWLPKSLEDLKDILRSKWRFDQDDKDAINLYQHVDAINPKIERVIEQKYSFHMDFSNQNRKSPANMGI